jgi:hypothetical protein
MTPAELEEHGGFVEQVRRSPTVAVIGDVPWR